MTNDRVKNWGKFSDHMTSYIRDRTVAKYGVGKSSFDLMSVTEPRVCIWNILKYALRVWNGKGKEHDLEKIAHYAELAWTLSGGEITTDNQQDQQQVGEA